MKKHFIYILTLFICFSCSEKNTQWKAERNATIFFGSEKDEKFELSFIKNGELLSYKYVNQIDSTKTIFIKKTTNSNSIFWGTEKFVMDKRKTFNDEKLNDLEFEFYNMEKTVNDGTGPILFNSEYGLLAINNVYGPTLIFLKKKDSVLIKQIINKLRE